MRIFSFILLFNTVSISYSQDTISLQRKSVPYYFWFSVGVPFTGGYLNKYTAGLGPSVDAQFRWKHSLVTIHHTFGGTMAAPDKINAWLFMYGQHYTKGFFYANASLGLAFVNGDYENSNEDIAKYDYRGFAYRAGVGINSQYVGVGAYYTGVKSKTGADDLFYWVVINIGKLR